MVHEDQPIAAGNYRFSVIGNQDVVKYIEAMLKTMISVICLIEESIGPFNGSQIVNLQIMDIEK